MLRRTLLARRISWMRRRLTVVALKVNLFCHEVRAIKLRPILRVQEAPLNIWILKSGRLRIRFGITSSGLRFHGAIRFLIF
uniref:Uncharacterized protein n=1 Tax=Picea glauca TaxID=3330 RepID=A0A101LTT6_PICGL|nr:hypothetical protein ABT39_MTgene3547 [Picea glauca]